MTSSNQIRMVKTVTDMSEPLKIGDASSPIRLVDYLFSERLEALTAIREDGRLFFATITKKENVMTGKVKRSVVSYELPVPETYRKKEACRASDRARWPACFSGLRGRKVAPLQNGRSGTRGGR